MSVSTVLAAKAYLAAGLPDAINDRTVPVFYDEPLRWPALELVWVGDVHRIITPYQMIGSGNTGWLDETYQISVGVGVMRGGDVPQEIFERACVIAGAVETFIRSDPSLGATVTQGWPALASYMSEGQFSDDGTALGRQTTVTIDVHCQARI